MIIENTSFTIGFIFALVIAPPIWEFSKKMINNQTKHYLKGGRE
tara:strand:- start:374 stop:505 length:132 start_codon:yes stop_codon:yes gene_type:complete